jgi:homoserine kinase
MQKIKIRLPAAIAHFGPGINSLGLALSLYTTVEVTPRTDDQLIVEPSGEGAKVYDTALRHPVVLALMHVFQGLERAPLGVHVKVDNHIPVGAGLGAETAFVVAGVTAANNLMGNPYTRHKALEIAANMSQPASAVTAVLGGFTASMLDSERLTYCTLPVASLKVIIALPKIEPYTRPTPPDSVPASTVTRIPLFMEAVRTGNLKLLADTVNDAPAYAQVAEMAKRAGAVAVTAAGDGPALLVFAEKKHEAIAAVTQQAFKNAGLEARTWVLSVDTQGILVSMMGSVT